MSRQKRKIISGLVTLGLLVGGIAYLFASSAGEAFEYYKHVDEVMAQPGAVGAQAPADARLRRARLDHEALRQGASADRVQVPGGQLRQGDRGALHRHRARYVQGSRGGRASRARSPTAASTRTRSAPSVRRSTRRKPDGPAATLCTRGDKNVETAQAGAEREAHDAKRDRLARRRRPPAGAGRVAPTSSAPASPARAARTSASIRSARLRLVRAPPALIAFSSAVMWFAHPVERLLDQVRAAPLGRLDAVDLQAHVVLGRPRRLDRVVGAAAGAVRVAGDLRQPRAPQRAHPVRRGDPLRRHRLLPLPHHLREAAVRRLPHRGAARPARA